MLFCYGINPVENRSEHRVLLLEGIIVPFSFFSQRQRPLVGLHQPPYRSRLHLLLVQNNKYYTVKPVIYSHCFGRPPGYSKSRHLRSILWTATSLVRPVYEVYLFCNSLDFMVIPPSFARPPAFYGHFLLKRNRSIWTGVHLWHFGTKLA